MTREIFISILTSVLLLTGFTKIERVTLEYAIKLGRRPCKIEYR
jgi:hypothetical protein